jgi:perosamine synthetase
MIALHEPRFTEEDEASVLEALRSTWVSTGGPFIDQFERDVADYVGKKYAIAVANGTIALQLALEVLKLQRDITSNFDVIVPTLSFIATANAVFHAQGTPILVDCAPNSMNIDPEQVEHVLRCFYERNEDGRLINRETGNTLLCILPAHIMGWTCDMEQLQALSRVYQVPIIEDAAEALGSRYHDGCHVGKGSTVATLSFNGNKILTTGGGGMLVTNDEDFARLAKHVGTTAKTDGLRYIHDQVGYNFRMVNLLAALGVAQLRRLSATLQAKEKILACYSQHLSDLPLQVHQEKHNKSNNWLVNVVFPDEAMREAVLAAALKRNIQMRPLWTPAHKLTFITPKNTLGQLFPHAENMWNRALSIPSSAHLTESELVEVVDVVKAALMR